MSVIVVDVDGPCVDSAHYWGCWLSDRFEYNKAAVSKWVDPSSGYCIKLPYNLAELYTIHLGQSGFDFWKDLRLYDTLKPIPQAVEYLNKLKQDGHELVYVSKCLGEHEASKFRFIKKYFPYDAVIFTWEKQYVSCDFVIEDSVSNLMKFHNKGHNADLIWYRTRYVEDVIYEPNAVIDAFSWKEVYEHIRSRDEILI